MAVAIFAEFAAAPVAVPAPFELAPPIATPLCPPPAAEAPKADPVPRDCAPPMAMPASLSADAPTAVAPATA
ncbi:hypothetical protein ACSFA3_02365 [Variovorax sp. RHLX14]|uniref:hypothetical protein n=1 Tax=Variovorax sp. RHLX14 TaxID=1259731 RepID=UPI003F47A776